MLKFISKILGGNKSEKDVAAIRPIVEKINQFFQQYQSLTNDELRNKTVEFKQRIKTYLSNIDAEIAAKKSEAEALPMDQIHAKDDIYQAVDKLKKERDKQIEEILKEIQPEAFAVVKETARRFTNNTELVSTATDLDRELSVKKDYISINNDQSIFKNSWVAGGTEIT
jgi:preprotein translocase subunit SecA